MNTAAQLIEAEIRQAFPAHRPKGLGPPSNGDREENIRIRADLEAVTDWTTLSPMVMAEIDRNSGFGFLTHEAARFHLPAFLIADLRETDLNSDPIDYLCVFDPYTSTNELISWQLALLRARWDELSAEQATAVCRYLEWRIATRPKGNEGGASHSLSAYWYERT